MRAPTTPIDLKEDLTMCFFDPGKVCSIDGSTARVMTNDGLHDVSLRLMEAAGAPVAVAVGDWVLVSLGLIVSVVDEAEATTLFNEMTALRSSIDW
jgi:hydrogenase assembly chaperone HypC/HupF